MHYGGFHAGYLVAILAIASPPSPHNIFYILVLSTLFAYSHFQKTRLKQSELRMRKPKLDKMFYRPNIRIVPMHLTVILGFGFLRHRLWLR